MSISILTHLLDIATILSSGDREIKGKHVDSQSTSDRLSESQIFYSLRSHWSYKIQTRKILQFSVACEEGVRSPW